MHDPRDFYLQRIRELGSEVDALKKTSDRIAWARLGLIVLVGGIIAASAAYTLHFLWLGLIVVIIFFRLVQRHLKIKDEIESLMIIARLCSDEIKLMAGDPHVFDPGPAQVYRDHFYSNDLDIFGSTSLFKTVNRTVTFEGRRQMIDSLLELQQDPVQIDLKREAIADLSDRVLWRHRFFAIGARSGESPLDISKLDRWLGQADLFGKREYWLSIASLSCSLSVGSIVWMLVVNEFLFGLFVGVLVFNSALLQFIAKDLKYYFIQFGSRTILFRKLSEMFDLVAKENFSSTRASSLVAEVKDASIAFLRLSRLHNLAEQRANAFVSFVMNGLFMFDVWTAYRIERWRKQHKDEAMPWIAALGTIDMLSSCANFKFNHPTFCDAEVSLAIPFIKATSMGHPLVPSDKVVVNDYEIGSGAIAHVITGSNMAGKSTFIRAVGLNVVLALNGLPVCATSFSCSVMKIASCIRITDSLEDHVSYFKAELDRLRVILDLLATGDAYLVLLDEILRGTNSDDKHEGTLSFYRKLGRFNCLSLLATHDLSIGRLEQDDPGRFANFCFESKVEGTELIFDYKLRKGVSSSANATFLMKKLRLID